MNGNYFISKNDKQIGPLDFNSIIEKIKNKEVSWMDYIFDESKNDWILIMEHKNFNQYFTESVLKESLKQDVVTLSLKAGVDKTENTESTDAPNGEDGGHGKDLKSKAWYVLKDKNNYGPFSVSEIIQMLQAKVIFEFDFLWQPKFTQWKRLAEIEEFSTSNIQNLVQSGNPDLAEVFFRRRNVRVNYGCSLVVHDNKRIYKGRSIEISSGGAGISIDSCEFMPGQNLFLHFQPGDGVPPFNAVCTIVSKQYVERQKQQDLDYRYGVKFTSISQNIRQKIQTFAELEKIDKKRVS